MNCSNLAVLLLIIVTMFSSVLFSQDQGRVLPVKKIMTVLNIDYPSGVQSTELKSRINEAMMISLVNSCDDLSIRSDFGMNDKTMSADEKIRLETEIRDILSLTIEERQAVKRESIISIKERTTSHYLFYSKIYYNANNDTERYEFSYNIILLDDMSTIQSGALTWSFDKTLISDLNIIFDDEFRSIQFCGETNTGDQTLESLKIELRSYASYVISNPNDESMSDLITENILSVEKIKRLYHSEYEAELVARILQYLPRDSTPLKEDAKVVLKVYYGILEQFYEYAIEEYPKLRKQYSKKLIKTKVQIQDLKL